MSDLRQKDPQALAASRLGGPGRVRPQECAAAAIAAMANVAGEEFHMTSLALDVASHALAEEDVIVRASADKRSRSIVFASAEARQGGRLVFSAQGLFSKGRQGT